MKPVEKPLRMGPLFGLGSICSVVCRSVCSKVESRAGRLGASAAFANYKAQYLPSNLISVLDFVCYWVNTWQVFS